MKINVLSVMQVWTLPLENAWRYALQDGLEALIDNVHK